MSIMKEKEIKRKKQRKAETWEFKKIKYKK
jgi:hypothetical protein